MRFGQLKRREFIALVGAAAYSASWPIAASAQQKAGISTIGFLGSGTHSSDGSLAAAFMQSMRQLGWVEGRDLAIEYRWGEGRVDQFAALAAELVRLKVDVIFTYGTPTAVAAKQATSVIPIVFTLVGAPVEAGLAASLPRPGSNITGVSNQSSDLGGKRLELLRSVLPNLRRIAIMVHVDNPTAVLDTSQVRTVADTFGLEITILEIRRAQDIAPAFDRVSGRVEALIVPPSALIFTNLFRINTLALGARLPTMYGARDYVEPGGLMSYGPNFPDLFRRSAHLVDKVLRGTKPADIPVEQPTKFDLVINLTTAKALGLQIPDKLLAIADEVIE
jgi:putative tryptophan/tyrosine transport system substrate-binding protein